MQIFANWILSLPAGQRPTTAAYATEDDPVLSPATEGVRATLEKGGVTTAYDKVYPVETSDYSPIALAVAHANADIVILGTNVPDAVAFVKTFVQQQYNPKALIEFTGPDQGTVFTDKVGANASGIFAPSGWFPDFTTFGNSDFVSAYTAKYGGKAADIPGDAAEAYSVGQQLAEAVAQTQSLDNKTLIGAFHSMQFQTVQGNWGYDATGKPTGGGILAQWVGGAFVAVYPTNVAKAAPVYPKPAWQP
jgi:branched-chain amino acid transport system substrate-binding protein